MIAPQELRIGNWIYDDDGIVCKVIGFQPFDHSTRCDESEGCLILIDIYRPDGTKSEGWNCDSNYMKPIELNEDWLLKFGFDSNNVAFKIDNDRFIFELYFYDEWNINYVEKTKFGNGSVELSGYWKIHELQNLFFDFTGEELKIKES